MRRSKGSGSVIFHNGAWELNIRSNGRRITRTLGKGSKHEAEAKADALIEVLPLMGISRAKAKVCGLPLKDVWGKFIAKPRTRVAKTIDGYESNWNVFLEWAFTQGLKNTRELQPEHVDAFLEALELRKVKGLLISEDTARRILKVVRRVLKGAGPAWGEMPSSCKAASKGKREDFTDEELQAAQKVFEDSSIGCIFKDELAVLHHIGLNTGLRLGDCCMLRWSSVDFEKGVLTVKPRKTARYDRMVSIPIVPELEQALRTASMWKDKFGYVLPNIAKRYESNACGIQKDYEYLLSKAGIQTSIEREGMRAVPLKTFHSLRHTFVSRLAEKGVSPLVIQSMSGHTSIAMTERYSHIGLEAKRKALAGSTAPSTEAAAQDSSGKPSIQETSAQQKLEALKVLLKGKVPEEVLALL